MATKLHEETFNTLQHTKHRVNENIAPSLFPTADELNDTEYWLFSDLYNLFGEQYMGTPNKIPDTFLSTINFSEFNKLPATNPDGEKRAHLSGRRARPCARRSRRSQVGVLGLRLRLRRRDAL